VNAQQHLGELRTALDLLERDTARLDRWGARIADVLAGGGRLLAAGNGGSAAQAQHLTAELVGRYLDDRPPFSAIALHAETSALTAIVNDYGPDEAFARGVRAHGRPGDVLLALSTSGRSGNVLAAARAARTMGIGVLALTGSPGTPLADLADDALRISGPTPTVQEIHQVAIHLICASFDRHVATVSSLPPMEVMHR
jgi:D-sedoheptulose 7-phosphate isomerase